MKDIAYKIIELCFKTENDLLANVNTVLNDYFRDKTREIALYRKSLEFDIVGKLHKIHSEYTIDNCAADVENLFFKSESDINDESASYLSYYW